MVERHMGPKISVIIPVYNTAARLPACLDSVLSQSHGDLEVILIDDGSTDGSGAVCDQYAAGDGRIRVIHQPNTGAAGARNAGLQAATGEFLSFVDSDDVLEPGAYGHMLDLLQRYDGDVVQCGFREIGPAYSRDRIPGKGRSVLGAQEYLALFVRDWTCDLLWDKLFRRCLFDGIRFPEGHRIDDAYVTYRVVMKADRVLRDDRVVYRYRPLPTGIMGSPESARQILLDRVDCLQKRRKEVIAQFPALRPVYDRHFLDGMVILSRDPAGNGESIAKIRRALKDYFKERGHTPVDYRLLVPLLKLCFGGTGEKGAFPWNRR